MSGWFLVLWWGVAASVTLAVLVALFKSGKPLRGALSSAASGVLAILLVDAVGAYTGVTLALNPLTLGTSAVLGVPGVITLLTLKAVLG